MGIHKWRFFSWAVTLLGAVLLVISYRSSGFRHGHWSALAVAGVVIILAGMVIHAVKFRCPSCGRHISDRTPPRHLPLSLLRRIPGGKPQGPLTGLASETEESL